jgi:hypothetical protein
LAFGRQIVASAGSFSLKITAKGNIPRQTYAEIIVIIIAGNKANQMFKNSYSKLEVR